MKVATLILTFAATMVTSFAIFPGEAPDARAVKVIARGIDCDACTRAYNFCVENGHTEGQTGCKQTCREHVCYLNAECKGCGDPFDQCPQNPRYINKH